MAKEILGNYIELIIRNHDVAHAILASGFNALIDYPRFRGVISKQIYERISPLDVNNSEFLGTLVLLKYLENSLGEKAKFPTDPTISIPEETVAFNIIRNIFESHTLQQTGRNIDSFLKRNENHIKRGLPRLRWPF